MSKNNNLCLCTLTSYFKQTKRNYYSVHLSVSNLIASNEKIVKVVLVDNEIHVVVVY